MADSAALLRAPHLHDLVLALNLTDPYSSSFKARSCRSLHDEGRPSVVGRVALREHLAPGGEP